jgi:hypothetical protein
MMERYWSRLRMPWLFVSLLCLIVPVFLPTSPYPHGLLDDAMGTATALMLILSFPLSLVAGPVYFIGELGFGARAYGIQRDYFYLLTIFALGLIQWFWIVPRLFQRTGSKLQILDLHTHTSTAALGEAHISPDFSFFDSDSKTPVERVIDDYSEKSR